MGHICKCILWLLSLIALSAGQVPVTSPVFISGYSQPIAGYMYSKFTGASGTLQPYFISKLNFDSIPGNIVVGAADWLYILNLNLTVVGQLNLPPNPSNAGCAAAIGYNPYYACRNHLRVFTSSPIDPTKLVVCGSEATGTPSCRTVSINNLVNFTTVTASYLVSIVPALYGFGITYNVNNSRGINFFAVSTLNFNASNTGLFFLTINYTNPTNLSSLTTVLQLRSTNSLANLNSPVFVDTYVANYAPRTSLLPGVMDTISPDEHKYFFVFATDVDNTTNTIRSNVIRVCQNDPGYSISSTIPNTLVKARINCQSTTYSTSYNAITGAAFNQLGRYYQNGDWALFMYGVFTTNVGGVAVSAVCVYPAYNSKNDATDAGGNNDGVFDIFRTPLINPLTGVRSSSGYVECTANGNLARPDYTYTDTSKPITQIGFDPLAVINGVGVTKIVLDQTCVVTNNTSAQTCVIQDVLFLGTSIGTVLKVAMGYISGRVFSVISEEIKLDDFSSVGQMSIQQQGGVKYLYVNTDTSIYRLPVQNCSRFLSCSTCVGSQDPYCAWDTSLSQCVVFSIVPTTYNGSASVPNGIYQNIHTGVVNNCPANMPSTVSTSSSGATSSGATSSGVTSSGATSSGATPSETGTPPSQGVVTAISLSSILPNIPSIAIVAGLAGLGALELMVIMILLCCCCRRNRLPNPSDPTPNVTYSKNDDVMIANPSAGLTDLNNEKTSGLMRSQSTKSDTYNGTLKYEEKVLIEPDSSLTAI